MACLLFAVVAAVTPGPSNIMLTTTGANVGILRGVPCLLGVTTGMGLMMFLVPLGLGPLVLDNAFLVTALHWAGVAVLLWLAWKIASARPTESRPEPSPVGFVGAAVFQWVNPKAWL
ncbi:MAG: LysE family translocator, partial [Candidatus Rokuibacteriota bacterium]